MTASLYRPADGLVALDDDQLRALLDHGRGRPVPPAQRAWLTSAGTLHGDDIDPQLRPLVAALLGRGPRLRLQTRERGTLTFNDAALPAVTDRRGGLGDGTARPVAGAETALDSNDTALPSASDRSGGGGAGTARPATNEGTDGAHVTDGIAGPDGVHEVGGVGVGGRDGTDLHADDGVGGIGELSAWDGVALVVRPPEVPVAYLHSLSRGTLARHLARRIGVGAHLLAARPVEKATELPDWASVRAAFNTEAPSGWAEGYRRAELHELRWAAAPGQPARTAMAVARLDGALAEVVPDAGQDGAYVVQPAEPRSLWLRLCRLLWPDALSAPPTV